MKERTQSANTTRHHRTVGPFASAGRPPSLRKSVRFIERIREYSLHLAKKSASLTNSGVGEEEVEDAVGRGALSKSSRDSSTSSCDCTGVRLCGVGNCLELKCQKLFKIVRGLLIVAMQCNCKRGRLNCERLNMQIVAFASNG